MTPSVSDITSMIQKRLDKLRDVILDKVKLKQGKTQEGWLITDPIAYVVTDVNADFV